MLCPTTLTTNTQERACAPFMRPFSKLCFCAGRSIKHNKALKRQTQPRALSAWTWRRSPISTCISRWPCIVVLGSQAPPNIAPLSVWAHNDLIVTQPLVWRRHFQYSDMLFLIHHVKDVAFKSFHRPTMEMFLFGWGGVFIYLFIFKWRKSQDLHEDQICTEPEGCLWTHTQSTSLTSQDHNTNNEPGGMAGRFQDHGVSVCLGLKSEMPNHIMAFRSKDKRDTQTSK